MLYQFLLYSTATQSYLYIHSFSHTIFHHVLAQQTEYSSLCCTAGTSFLIHSKCKSLQQPTPNSQFTPLPPYTLLGNHKSVLYVCEAVSVL